MLSVNKISSLFIIAGIFPLLVFAAPVLDRTTPVTGHMPVVRPALNTLTPAPGQPVTVTPNFSDPDGDAAQKFEYEWMMETAPGSGSYRQVPQQNTATFTPQMVDNGKSMYAIVIPYTDPAVTEPFRGAATASPFATINVGMPSVASSVSIDKTDYQVGEIMTVTISLKDAWKNPISNSAGLLTTTTVKINDVEMQSPRWIPVPPLQDGTYTARFVLKKASPGTSGSKVSLQFPGWLQPVSKIYYVIEPVGHPDYSTIASDKSVYSKGETMNITLTLWNDKKHLVPDRAAILNYQALVIVNGAFKSVSWKEIRKGVYTATYKAKTSVSGEKIKLKMPGWKTYLESTATYTIN